MIGSFNVTIQVGDILGRRFVAVDALVDTGSSYLVVPGSLLKSLGVEASERSLFELADGSTVEFDLADVMLRLDGRTHSVLAVFGQEDTRPLLGVVALETFRLQVDPVHRRLVRVPGLLMSNATRA